MLSHLAARHCRAVRSRVRTIPQKDLDQGRSRLRLPSILRRRSITIHVDRETFAPRIGSSSVSDRVRVTIADTAVLMVPLHSYNCKLTRTKTRTGRELVRSQETGELATISQWVDFEAPALECFLVRRGALTPAHLAHLLIAS